MFELDFSLLPPIESTSILIGIDRDLERSLSEQNIPETTNRIKASGHFFGNCSSKKDTWLNNAFLRAGLSEFRSVNQALRWDNDGSTKNIYWLKHSKNPLVHLMWRLRRINVYVSNPEFDHYETTLYWADENAKNNDFDYKALVIKDIEHFFRLENLKDYKEEDIYMICEWFKNVQYSFGAPEVFIRGVECFAKELIKFYSQK